MITQKPEKGFTYILDAIENKCTEFESSVSYSNILLYKDINGNPTRKLYDKD